MSIPLVAAVHGESPLIALLLTVTIIKLALAGVWGGTAEIPQMLEQARAYMAGRDLLDPRSMGGNPSFFPIGHYLLATACLLISQWTGITFSFLIKAPAILADLGVSLLLRAMPRGGNRPAILYMLNPVTFILSVYHGQLHTVALAGAVFALWLADRSWFGLGSLILGLAASVRQHYAVLVVPLAMVSGRRRNVTLVVFAFILFLLNAPLLGAAHPDRILAPTWTYGSWGYTMLLLQGPRVFTLVGFSHLGFVPDFLNRTLQAYGFLLYWIWAAVFGLWTWRRGGGDLWHAALFFLVGLYVVSPGFGVQWLVWAVPFWLIVNPYEATGYSALAGAFLTGSYWQWGLNAKYGVTSLTANLNLLTWGDLAGVLLVGALGFLTWVYCAKAAWRLARA